MLKIIAILLNIIIFVLWTWEAITEGFSGVSGLELLMVLILFITPVITILALLLGKDNWITLYLRRKAIEEKKKIERMEKT